MKAFRRESVPSTVVELAERVNDGLEVVQLWDRASGGLWVDVRGRSGASWAVTASPELSTSSTTRSPTARAADDVGDLLLAA
jgi:hypothetical protein